MRAFAIAALVAFGALVVLPRAASARTPGAKQRIGVLPSRVLNVDDAERARLDTLLRARLRDGRRLELVTSARIDAALGKRGPTCVDDAACLRDVGQRIAAVRLLAPRFGRLAETLIVRLTIYEAASGTRQGSLQEVLSQTDAATLRSAFDRMLDGFAPRPRDTPRLYQRWWFWTAIGVAVVGGAVTAIVLATRGERPTNEFFPPPP